MDPSLVTGRVWVFKYPAALPGPLPLLTKREKGMAFMGLQFLLCARPAHHSWGTFWAVLHLITTLLVISGMFAPKIFLLSDVCPLLDQSDRDRDSSCFMCRKHSQPASSVSKRYICLLRGSPISRIDVVSHSSLQKLVHRWSHCC